MGNANSCIPRRLKRSKKRRKRLRENREQVQEQIYSKLPNGLETDQNHDYFSLQAETCSLQATEQNDQCETERTLLSSSIKEWDQSGMKQEDLGKMIHCSKVKISRHSCKDIYDRRLVLFPNHLLILSEDFHGFTYQGMLPLAGISVHAVDRSGDTLGQRHAFQITGPLLHPFTVYCSTKEEVKEWLYYLGRQRHESRKIPGTSRVPTSRNTNSNSLRLRRQNVDWKTVVLSQSIHGGERTRIGSLGEIIWISEASLQHLPSQEKHDRLLVLFPATLLILSQEDRALYYKGELSLNAVTISEHEASENNSRTLIIEGRMINQIVVTCPSGTVHRSLIHQLHSAGVTVHQSSPFTTGGGGKRSVRCKDQFADKSNPLLGSQAVDISPGQVYGVFTFPKKPIEMISVSEDLPALVAETERCLSPDYSEPYTPPPSRLSAPPAHSMLPPFADKHKSSPLPAWGASMVPAGRKLHALSQPPPLPSAASDKLLVTGNRRSFGYAEPFAAPTTEAAVPVDTFTRPHSIDTRDPLMNWEQNTNRTSGSDISRPSRVSSQLGNTTANHGLPDGECLSNPLSPTYAEPYMPFKLQPAPPAKPLWLREPVIRHSSSCLPAWGCDQDLPLRKTLALSQLPSSSSCALRRDHYSLRAGQQAAPLPPVYAKPFAARLSAAATFKQGDLSSTDHWSNRRPSAESRPSLPSGSGSESSSCAHVNGEPSCDPLSPMYAEPYHSFQYQSVPLPDHFWMRDEVSREGSSEFPVHCSKDDTSEYFAIMEVLDSYREEKSSNRYSDDTRFSFTSSEPTYAELESPQTDGDDRFWDFKQQIMPCLSPATLRKLHQRGVAESRQQGMLHRWS
ncbi:pleckstrin homology domain-containing family N member 1 [Amblyraja radiata]|uniref:pleckstrin homology domain-containing family N member 1 n=1 Tax=Amblyraja radiata TaxID=386614 RepID=UPI0014040BE4|nr:pleckstrin homology domain-containing family N member 1 [Amblyraja radiata]